MRTAYGAQWKKAIASVVTAVAALLFIYRDVVSFTVKTWWDNGTYTHGFLIFPISLWLIARKRSELSAILPSPEYRGIAALFLSCLLWQLGYQAGAMVVEQYSLVFMIIASVWTILGSEVFRSITFPMFFLLFSVPFGEALIPWMMNFTADFTVAALQFTGIPVFREGTFFSLPSGNWSVVEACSGLRYFVSSLTLGVLYAYLTYRSTLRRLLFVAASALIPIIANGLRAYMIVMIGHLSGMRLATGIDHLIYGWLFFGIVMLLLFWTGSFFKENQDAPEVGLPVASHQRESGSFIFTLAAILVVAMLSSLYAAHLDRVLEKPVVYTLVPPPGTGPWQPDPRSLSDWTPHYLGSRAELKQTYRKGEESLSLYLAYYRNQHMGTELISSQNKLVTTFNKIWGNIGESQRTLHIDGERIPLVQAKLRSSDLHLLAWQWYWVDGRWVTNPYLAKALEAKSRLLSGRDDAAVVILYAPYTANPETAADDLHDFLQSMLPEIEHTLKTAQRPK